MILKKIFFLLIVKPIIFIIIGLNIRHFSRLPKQGPAIIVANHNSHLDTMVLMSLFPLKIVNQVRPVAAAEYFMNKGLFTWFVTRFIDIIPLDRMGRKSVKDRLLAIESALINQDIVIIYPEGSRGRPESLSHFKKGVARLVQNHSEIPVIPIFLHGLGKCLPKNEGLLVPFICDVFIGEALYCQTDCKAFTDELEKAVINMAKGLPTSDWS